MPTTTIRLPENLKARVAAAAKRSGTTTHGFVLEAIAEKTKPEDLRADFDAALGIQPPTHSACWRSSPAPCCAQGVPPSR